MVLSKSLKEQYITDFLSQLEKDASIIVHYHHIQSYQDLKKSASDLLTQITKPAPTKTTQPFEVRYSNSLHHFFLYFMPPPNYPFLLRIGNIILFGAFTGRHYTNLMISIPFSTSASETLNTVHHVFNHPRFSSFQDTISLRSILLRDIDHKVVNLIRKETNLGPFHLQSMKQIRYNIYDVNKTLNLHGESYANLRWHLNAFHNAGHSIQVVPLEKIKKPVVHLIGQWRKDALQRRGFSWVDTRSDKQGIDLVTEEPDQSIITQISKDHPTKNTILSRILKIDGSIASFNLGFPLGILQTHPVFAHAIGIADTSIPHIAEYAQYDFWKLIKQHGYQYINDGPSWRNSLETYKEKFRPFLKKDYYWATLTAPS